MNETGRAMLKAILWGGLVAGTIDIFAASAINAISPIVIGQAIASGLLGKPAYDGGLPVALLGVLLQWGMSLIISTIYVVGAMRVTALRHNWVLGGIAYGVVIYFVMNYVVVPLSAAWPPADFSKPIQWGYAAENMLAMLLFGLIIAFFACRFLAAPQAKSTP